jgi:ankyrin repeat protein
MSALLDAIAEGNLEQVKRLIAEGADVAEADACGYTALLEAAYYGDIPIMDWLLNEGGSSLTERDINGTSALLMGACMGRFPAMQYLLEKLEALVSETTNVGRTVWDCMKFEESHSAELSSLLKVMVMLEDAPADFIAKLSPQRADICERGRELRAQLPSYLKQQRAALVAQCPLPAVLRCLVTAYAVTTPEDMWADGLRM